MKTYINMHQIKTILKAEDNLCVERFNFFVNKPERIPLIWLAIGLVICELVICELCIGHIYRL